MATKNTEVVTKKGKALSYSAKFGLDKDRKKLGVMTDEKVDPPIFYPGKNFQITRIVMTQSKKKYDVQGEDGELLRAKIPIAQFDVIHEDGTIGKYYSPNGAIVEACENILKDEEFEANKETGILSTHAEITNVIEGKGEKNHGYIAFI